MQASQCGVHYPEADIALLVPLVLAEHRAGLSRSQPLANILERHGPGLCLSFKCVGFTQGGECTARANVVMDVQADRPMCRARSCVPRFRAGIRGSTAS